MPHWKEEQLQQLMSETNDQRMFHSAASLVEQLGMEYFSFTLRIHIPQQKSRIHTFNTYPTAWNERYQARNYVSVDPIVAHCHISLEPILWQDQVFRETPELWEHAQLHGLRFGWSQSAHDLQHNESILTVIRSHIPVDTPEFYNCAGQTIWLCNLIHTLLVERQAPTPSLSVRLSTRETEVLKWSAAGKTAADIACILTLSRSTVNFHIRSIITKMNSSNKAGAIAIAAMSGLLG